MGVPGHECGMTCRMLGNAVPNSTHSSTRFTTIRLSGGHIVDIPASAGQRLLPQPDCASMAEQPTPELRIPMPMYRILEGMSLSGEAGVAGRVACWSYWPCISVTQPEASVNTI